jgi:hypothetical protein
MKRLDSACDEWSGALALHVFGALPIEEQPSLLAHLDGCAACTQEVASMHETYEMLSYVDPANVALTADVPRALADRVLGELHQDGVRGERRRRVRHLSSLALALAAVVVAFVALTSTFAGQKPAQKVLALSGNASVHANVVLSAKDWGTAVSLHEQGLPANSVYTVSMRTSSGQWWVAGTMRPRSSSGIVADMACAVAMGRITGVRVTANSGAVVLSSYAG